MLVIYQFYNVVTDFANGEAINYVVTCNKLSGNCLIQITSLIRTNGYTRTQTDTNIYMKTQVDGFMNALNADGTDLMESDATNCNWINRASNVLALSASLPEAYLQIPASSFIAVRRSDISGNVVIFNDSGTTFSSPTVFNGGMTFNAPMVFNVNATFSGTNEPMMCSTANNFG